MIKSLVVLAVAGSMSASVAAQNTQPADAANQAQQAKPQMVKKRVCEESDENAFSRVKTKTCKTVMVPARPAAAGGQQGPAQAPQSNNGQ